MGYLDEIVANWQQSGATGGASGEIPDDIDTELQGGIVPDTSGIPQQLAHAQRQRERGMGRGGLLGANPFSVLRSHIREDALMADLISAKQITEHGRQQILTKANKIFEQLRDANPDNDADALMKLRKLSFNAQVHYQNDFGLGNAIDRYEKASMADRLASIKEQPKPLTPAQQKTQQVVDIRQEATTPSRISPISGLDISPESEEEQYRMLGVPEGEIPPEVLERPPAELTPEKRKIGGLKKPSIQQQILEQIMTGGVESLDKNQLIVWNWMQKQGQGRGEPLFSESGNAQAELQKATPDEINRAQSLVINDYPNIAVGSPEFETEVDEALNQNGLIR